MRLIIVSFIFMFISCQGKKQENFTNSKEFVNSKNNIEQKLKAYCFYKLDDKYSIEKDSLAINSWLKEKSKLILKNDSIESIFNQNGGGPIGAEWNPGTDLYIAIFTSINKSSNVPKLSINGKSYRNIIYEQSPYLTWHQVKRDFWEKEIREIEFNDIENLFPVELSDRIGNGEIDESWVSEYGEILKFEFTYEEQKIIGFFHATFGE